MAGSQREVASGDPPSDVVSQVAAARQDPGSVVLEGLHPLKHALRFGARVGLVVAEDGFDLAAAATELAPDLPDRLPGPVQVVTTSEFAQLTRRRPGHPLVAVADRPSRRSAPPGPLEAPAPVVLLEDPVHLGNVGAAVRVAAAAGAAAVVTTGRADPWHPAALRGSAGLHFALPVLRQQEPLSDDRPVVALDPGGAPLTELLPPTAILAFGSERHGLSPALRRRADRLVTIPMRPGVSSLNLATSVAVALYAFVQPTPPVQAVHDLPSR